MIKQLNQIKIILNIIFKKEFPYLVWKNIMKPYNVLKYQFNNNQKMLIIIALKEKSYAK